MSRALKPSWMTSLFFCTIFDSFLEHLIFLLKRFEEIILILNWKKHQFMVTMGIILGHKISKGELEVEITKIQENEKLPPPTFVKRIRSFLEHVIFYKRLIKSFLQNCKTFM